jgi:transglutaminase-like putative cysteine protease
LGCSLAYDVVAPTAAFTFNVFPALDGEQRIVTESIVCAPEISLELLTSARGDRLLRVEAPAGRFELRYAGEVELTRAPFPAEIAPDRPGRLPLSILTYTLPSRYCESDLLAPNAWELFGGIPDRAEQVRAICRWVKENVTYTAGSTDSRTSAGDVWQLRKGVCRDFVHLAIALCRGLTIPARYVGCYAAGLEPMDFHACFETYLGGAWRLFDATEDIGPDATVVVARGRDATQAGLTTIYGRVVPGPVKVECVVEERGVPNPLHRSVTPDQPPPNSLV